tara:strand:- start:41 stop:340 length:300 start_codon:yes stop_codon:yes gene_type:complete
MKTMLIFQEAENDSFAYPADQIQSINVGANAIVITFLTATGGEDVLTLTTDGDEFAGLVKLCQAIGAANYVHGSGGALVVFDKVGGVDVTGISTAVAVA